MAELAGVTLKREQKRILHVSPSEFFLYSKSDQAAANCRKRASARMLAISGEVDCIKRGAGI